MSELENANDVILSWCRKQGAGVACMRDMSDTRLYLDGLLPWPLIVTNVNTGLLNWDRTLNREAIHAMGPTWEDVLDSLRASGKVRS